MNIKLILKSNNFLYTLIKFIKNKTENLNFIKIKYEYKNSKYFNEIKKFKNIHNNKRCFIIGNGPSLQAKDLDKLKDEITFGTNKIFFMFNNTKWRPTYYCCTDYLLAKNIIDDINNMNEVKEKFIPYKNIHFNDNNQIKGERRILVNFNDKKRFPQNFSEDISNEVCCGHTVTYVAIQIAIYMGFKEIYLIGIDHNYSMYKDINGKIIVNNKVKDYFTEGYKNNKKEGVGNIGNLEMMNISYKTAKKYADKNNIKIYNATRGGKLEVFKRVDFDKIDF